MLPVNMGQSLLTSKHLFLYNYLVSISVFTPLETLLCFLVEIVLLNTEISKQYDPGSWGLEANILLLNC